MAEVKKPYEEKVKIIRSVLADSLDTLKVIIQKNSSESLSGYEAAAILEHEMFNLELLCLFTPSLLDCHPKTIEAAFRKTIMQNLSFDKDLSLIYSMTRNTKTELGDFIAFESKPTVNGWISIYRQNGSLIDLDSKVTYHPTTKQVEAVEIFLTVPRYDLAGNIISEQEKVFGFGKENFKSWQKYSHMSRISASNPGNIKTLNLAGDNYYSYKPVMLHEKDFATPDNPGGIQPGFAITKCLGHALKQAKLERNPYAKKVFNPKFVHRKYVDVYPEEPEAPATTSSFDDYEEQKPETSRAVHQVIKPEPQINQEKPKDLPKENSEASLDKKPSTATAKQNSEPAKSEASNENSEDAPKLKEIMDAVLSSKTSQEVMDIFKKNADILNRNLETKKAIGLIGTALVKKEKEASMSGNSTNQASSPSENKDSNLSKEHNHVEKLDVPNSEVANPDDM